MYICPRCGWRQYTPTKKRSNPFVTEAELGSTKRTFLKIPCPFNLECSFSTYSLSDMFQHLRNEHNVSTDNIDSYLRNY